MEKEAPPSREGHGRSFADAFDSENSPRGETVAYNPTFKNLGRRRRLEYVVRSYRQFQLLPFRSKSISGEVYEALATVWMFVATVDTKDSSSRPLPQDAVAKLEQESHWIATFLTHGFRRIWTEAWV